MCGGSWWNIYVGILIQSYVEPYFNILSGLPALVRVIEIARLRSILELQHGSAYLYVEDTDDAVEIQPGGSMT